MSISNLTSIHFFHSGGSINGETKLTSAQSISTTETTQLSGVVNRQDALEKLNDLLTQAYDKLSFRAVHAIEKYQANTPLTAEKVANNVLGFITRRLQQDQAEGATPEQLQSRLDAGLAGFKKGFAEAAEQLKALSLFSPEVEEDLAKTNELVLEGIKGLQNKLATGEAWGTPVATSSPGISVNGIAVGVALMVQQTQAYKFDNIDYAQAEARDFTFAVTTKEGDKVTIHASSSYGADIHRQGSTLTGSYSESKSFSLEVEGNLNADELHSINQLLGKVNTLAEKFYAGEYDNAFMNADTLDFDDDQLNQFSLRLSQAKIEATQIETSPIVQPIELSEKSKEQFWVEDKALGNFIEALLDALDEARLFNNPEKLILDIAKGIQLLNTDEDKPEVSITIDHPKSFDDFLGRLLGANANNQKS